MRRIDRVGLVVLLVSFLTITGRAAGVSLRGSVVDPAGTPLPGATVELLSGAHVLATVSSGSDGAFSFANLTAGSYELRVTLRGFRQTRATISIGAAAPPALLLKLQIGNESDVVEETVPAAKAQMPGGVAGGVVGGVAGGVPAPAPQTLASPGVSRGYGGGYGGGVANQIVIGGDTATYASIDENRFRRVEDAPLSTFSIDVDTASYANVRRFLNEGQLPPADAVRVEELINYFHFDYPDSTQGAPFGITTEIAACPWNARHRLALIGLQAKRIAPARTPPRNLVFLLDVSGSMTPPERLPLIRTAMNMLVDTLRGEDRVAIVTYAGTTGVALPSTPGDRHDEIRGVISSLRAGGSTNGGAGIQLAYDIAGRNFVEGGINRVILATDGDFNVGVTDPRDLVRMIEARRNSGIFLSVLGVGDDNLKDATMERLADKGNGNYAYLDSLSEAQRVLVAEAGATLVTVAKDVKIQVEFNPTVVAAYRLVGYEDRKLRARDFNDDSKDAGDLGAGHTVTALYEVVPPGEESGEPGVDPLKYQRPPKPQLVVVPSNEMMTVKVRYKRLDSDRSLLLTVPVLNKTTGTPARAGFAAAVAEFGMLLRQSPYRDPATWEDAEKLAASTRGSDPEGYRAEFVRLVDLAAALDRQRQVGQQRDQ